MVSQKVINMSNENKKISLIVRKSLPKNPSASFNYESAVKYYLTSDTDALLSKIKPITTLILLITRYQRNGFPVYEMCHVHHGVHKNCSTGSVCDIRLSSSLLCRLVSAHAFSAKIPVPRKNTTARRA